MSKHQADLTVYFIHSQITFLFNEINKYVRSFVYLLIQFLYLFHTIETQSLNILFLLLHSYIFCAHAVTHKDLFPIKLSFFLRCNQGPLFSPAYVCLSSHSMPYHGHSL